MGKCPIRTTSKLDIIFIFHVLDNLVHFHMIRHTFHYVVSSGITFLCMTEQSIPRRTVFAFLDDIIAHWRSRFTEIDEQTAIAFSLNDAFAPLLQERLV